MRLTSLSLVLVSLAPTLATQEAAPRPSAKAGAAAAEAQAKEPAKVALLRFGGVYADLPQQGADLTALILGGGAKPKSFFGLMDRLEELSADANHQDFLVDLSGGFAFNAAQMAEVERAFRKLRGAGKRTVAYLENAGPVQMQVAALCDEVLMADMGVLELPSMSLSVMFLKDAMDLLGVQMDVLRCGDFKGAVEPYMLSRMSRHLREHYQAMLSRINDDMVRRIAAGRAMERGAVRRLQEARLVPAKAALQAGLVDKLVPWAGAKKAYRKHREAEAAEFVAALSKKKQRKQLNFFSLMTQLLNPKKKEDKLEPGIAVLHLSGQIVDGAKAQAGSIVSGPTVAEIHRLAKAEAIQGVVVRINSPGGSATASEAILLALKELAAKKPVVFSMGRLAASGGYYVTCIGRPILAEAGTITGSIGVFGMRPNLGPLMRRVGVHEEVVALDEGATMNALGQAWSGSQKERLQKVIDNIYDRFTGHVAASRGMPVSEVLEIAGGRVWSGEQALSKRLVDRIGGLEDALALVAKEAGLEKGYKIQHLPKPTDMFQQMLQEMLGADAGRLQSLLPKAAQVALQHKGSGLERALRLLLDNLNSTRSMRVYALMPASLELR